jgi:DNA polymerase-3 subunit alpha
VIVGGSILDVREIMTKSGKKMAFVKIEDRTSEVEVILFPNSYQQTLGTWQRDRVVLIRGKISAKDRNGEIGDEVKILVDDAREITIQQAQQYEATGRKKKTPKAAKVSRIAMARQSIEVDPVVQTPAKLYVRLDSGSDTQALLTLKQTIDAHSGQTDVILVLGSPDSRQVIKLPGGINPESPGVSQLAELVGADNVRLQ